MESKSIKVPYWIILLTGLDASVCSSKYMCVYVGVCFQCLPLSDQSDCPIEAAQAAVRNVGHRCRGAGVCPGHGNPHSCASRSSFDPSK